MGLSMNSLSSQASASLVVLWEAGVLLELVVRLCSRSIPALGFVSLLVWELGEQEEPPFLVASVLGLEVCVLQAFWVLAHRNKNSHRVQASISLVDGVLVRLALRPWAEVSFQWAFHPSNSSHLRHRMDPVASAD